MSDLNKNPYVKKFYVGLYVDDIYVTTLTELMSYDKAEEWLFANKKSILEQYPKGLLKVIIEGEEFYDEKESQEKPSNGESMNKRLSIYVESMCRTDILGDRFDLPDSPELENAILTINQACCDEVARRQKHELAHFIAMKYSELFHGSKKTQEEKQQLMLEIVNYNREKKLALD